MWTIRKYLDAGDDKSNDDDDDADGDGYDMDDGWPLAVARANEQRMCIQCKVSA